MTNIRYVTDRQTLKHSAGQLLRSKSGALVTQFITNASSHPGSKSNMRATSKKKFFAETAKEYASRTSIHGISYISDQRLSLVDRILWLLVVLAFVGLATILTWDIWEQWEEEQVVTTLKNTAKPVTEVPFPTVTICGAGLHMTNVEKKIGDNFVAWRRENKRHEESMEGIEKDMEDYMAQTFQIETGSSVNLLDILNTLIAPNTDETLAANAVRENVLACQDSSEKESSPMTQRQKRETSYEWSCQNQRCFYLSSKKASYPEAVNECQSLNAELASIVDIGHYCHYWW